jgi:hypothetical protein
MTTLLCTVNQFIIFVRGPEEELWIRENDRCDGLYKIGFVHGPQQLKEGSEKTIHLGTIYRAFTV